jgi:hypothetical protein
MALGKTSRASGPVRYIQWSTRKLGYAALVNATTGDFIKVRVTAGSFPAKPSIPGPPQAANPALARPNMIEQDSPPAAPIACAEIGDCEIPLAITIQIGDGDLNRRSAAGHWNLVLKGPIAITLEEP